MEIAENIYTAFKEYHNKQESDASWSESHPEYWKIVVDVTQLMEGKKNNGGSKN